MQHARAAAPPARPRAASTTSPVGGAGARAGGRPRPRLAADVDDAVGDRVGAVAAVLGDQHGRAARPPARRTQRQERRGGRRRRAARSARPAAAPAGPARARRPAPRAAARRPTACRPCGSARSSAPTRSSARARARRELVRPARRGSRGRTRRRAAPSRYTTCASGSWKAMPARRATAAGAAVRVSSPSTWTWPAKRPPWKCGTRPANARSSVVLPPPDGPGQHHDLAPAQLAARRRSSASPAGAG